MNLRRLGGLDAAFLAAENEANHMHMMAIMLLDKDTIPGGYTFEKVRDFTTLSHFSTSAIPES